MASAMPTAMAVPMHVATQILACDDVAALCLSFDNDVAREASMCVDMCGHMFGHVR